MLKEYVGLRTSGLLFCTSTGAQLLQANTLQDSLHPILDEMKQSTVALTSSGASASLTLKNLIAQTLSSIFRADTHRHTYPRGTRISMIVLIVWIGPSVWEQGLCFQLANLAYCIWYG
jgi:hypothetical protein